MLANFVAQFIEWALDFLLGVLDLFPLPSPPDLMGYAATMAPIFGFIGWANQYFPLDIAAGLAAMFLTLWAAFYLGRFVLWGLTKLHILGGSSDA